MEPDSPTSPMMPKFTYSPGSGRALPAFSTLWGQGTRTRIALVVGGVGLALLLCCGTFVSWATSPAGVQFNAQANATNTAVAASATTYALAHPKPTATLKPTQAPTDTAAPGATQTATLAVTATVAPTSTVVIAPTATTAPVVIPTATTAPVIQPTATTPPVIVPTNTPIPQGTCGAPSNPFGYTFCGGNYIYSPNANFCNYFSPCVSSFWTSTNGYVVQCINGVWSHSGGITQGCNKDGGQGKILYGP